jgi:hypothetical protein
LEGTRLRRNGQAARAGDHDGVNAES